MRVDVGSATAVAPPLANVEKVWTAEGQRHGRTNLRREADDAAGNPTFQNGSKASPLVVKMLGPWQTRD